jgi:hypothetical protein
VREMIKYRFRVPSVAVFTLYSYSKALEYLRRVWSGQKDWLGLVPVWTGFLFLETWCGRIESHVSFFSSVRGNIILRNFFFAVRTFTLFLHNYKGCMFADIMSQPIRPHNQAYRRRMVVSLPKWVSEEHSISIHLDKASYLTIII